MDHSLCFENYITRCAFLYRPWWSDLSLLEFKMAERFSTSFSYIEGMIEKEKSRSNTACLFSLSTLGIAQT
jgi:hypothetical protein